MSVFSVLLQPEDNTLNQESDDENSIGNNPRKKRKTIDSDIDENDNEEGSDDGSNDVGPKAKKRRVAESDEDVEQVCNVMRIR